MWSQAIGLGISAFSAANASSQNVAAQNYANYFKRRQLDFQNANFALALDQERERKEDNEYRRQIEMLNRSIAADERREQLRQVQDDGYIFKMPLELGIYYEDKNLFKLETVKLEKEKGRFYIATETKPKNIKIDPFTKLLAIWDFNEIK